MPEILKAPFPWFGGKSRAAELIWPRFGDVPNYVEPFAGSLAVLLRRPHAPGNEIVNDLDCYVANAWRAMKHAPAEVAAHCDWPVNEADLHARHRWLHGRAEFRLRMENDPDHYDPKIAAWWIWGLSCWIGDAFCRIRCGSTPHLSGAKGVAKKITDNRRPQIGINNGVHRKIPAIDQGGKCVSRQLPCITGTASAALTHRGQPGGKGINGAGKITLDRKRPALAPWKGTPQAQALLDWFDALATRLRFTKVCCGDWVRVCTKAATYGQALTAVMLDPPYARDIRDADIYSNEVDGVSASVREWAIANGENPLLRIALCGYEGEHHMPDTWECVAWKAAGGYANRNAANQNATLERIWFSPHCLRPQPELFDFSAAPDPCSSA